jgi:hypothetical protein
MRAVNDDGSLWAFLCLRDTFRGASRAAYRGEVARKREQERFQREQAQRRDELERRRELESRHEPRWPGRGMPGGGIPGGRYGGDFDRDLNPFPMGGPMGGGGLLGGGGMGMGGGGSHVGPGHPMFGELSFVVSRVEREKTVYTRMIDEK